MFAQATLPAEPASAAAARRFVRATLLAWRLPDFLDAATLLVSELVTNAILHAGSTSVLSIGYDDGVLRVGVADSAPGRVQQRSYPSDAGTGRGLVLIDALAAAWGSAATAGGKQVWFELDVTVLSRGLV